MNVTCALINFNSSSIEFILQMLSTSPWIEICQIIPTLELGITELGVDKKPKITFLWIGLNDKKWQTKASIIAEKSNALVIVSQRSSHASIAYDLKAIDFLKFPFSLNRFKQCILQSEMVIQNLDFKSLPDYFFVKTLNEKRQLVKIPYRDVVCFESKDKGVIIHTTTKKVQASCTLRQVEIAISRHSQFIRIQRSFIISVHHIENIEHTSVKLINYGQHITVGKIYLEQYLSWLKPLTIHTTSL